MKPGKGFKPRKTKLKPVSVKATQRRQSFNAERSLGEACYMCGLVVEGSYMEGHHELEASQHPQLRGDPSNRKPACRDCHQKITDNRDLNLEPGETRPKYEKVLAARRLGQLQGYEVDNYGKRIN